MKNYLVSNILSFLCSICFGVGNYINATLASKYGVKVIYMMFPGLALQWLTHHLITMWKSKQSLKDYLSESSYRHKETKKIELWRLAAPMMRCFIQACIQINLSITFYFAAKAKINGGIVASIFASGVIFVAVIFYFKYG